MSWEEDILMRRTADLEARVAKLERGAELRTFETPQRERKVAEEQPPVVEEFGGQPDSEEEEEADYSEWTVTELRQELEGRKLGTDGKKAELVARLLADDEQAEE